MTRRCLIAAVAFFWMATTRAQVTLDAVPGGLAEIPLASSEQPRPEAFFGQKRIIVMPFGPQWVGLVGLSLDLVPGKYVIQAVSEESEDPVTYEFTVHPKRIGEQAIIQLPYIPLDVPKVAFSWREPLDAQFPLNPPVSAPVIPSFGHYHRVSDTESIYLEFVAFRVDRDTSVFSPGDGRIAVIESLDTGTFVWIDHGMALFTCIGPLSRTTVSQDDPVQSGQSIGKLLLDTIDEPGFLYWSVFMNGTAVNPSLVSELVEDEAPRANGRVNSG